MPVASMLHTDCQILELRFFKRENVCPKINEKYIDNNHLLGKKIMKDKAYWLLSRK